MKLIVEPLPFDDMAFANCLYVSQDSICQFKYAKIKNYVFEIRKCNGAEKIEKNSILISGKVREPLSCFSKSEIEVENFNETNSYMLSCNIELETVRKNLICTIDYAEIIKIICEKNKNQYFCNDHVFLILYNNTKLILTMKKCVCVDFDKNCDVEHGRIDENTKITLVPKSDALEILNSPDETNTKQLFNMNPRDLENLGVGGLSEEFSMLFRRAFVSRLVPPSMQKTLNIKHTKGVLLYGPPGTGKTLIARKIGKLLNCKEPKIVNGPEILSKFVGESEKNIRELFADAEKEQEQKGDKSQLHLVIFDEFDSLCKKRGMTNDGTGVGDNIVNQLLSKMDGVNSLNNILLIGMTNRKDLIDEAILRQGRFEVHIKISLPDENGRYEIFKIHTNKLKNDKKLKEDVDLKHLAKITKNYSGAEIESVVKSAESFSFQKHIDKDNPSKLNNLENFKVCQNDFIMAINEITPSFGNDIDEKNEDETNAIINYGERWEDFDTKLKTIISNFKAGGFLTTHRLLLHGDSGSGKTTISKYMSKILDYPYVKIIRPTLFVGNSETQKLMTIKKIFDDAYQSTKSTIIIDDIERIIDFSEYGNRYSNAVLQTLLTLINDNAKKNNKLFIIGTCKNKQIMESLELFDIFDKDLHVENIHLDEIQRITDYYDKECKENYLIELPIKKLISRLFTE